MFTKRLKVKSFQNVSKRSVYETLQREAFTKRLKMKRLQNVCEMNYAFNSISFGPCSSAPLEAKQFLSYVPGTHTVTRSYSREPSVTVTITTGPGWRRSLSRDVSGDSDASEAKGATGSSIVTHNFRRKSDSESNLHNSSSSSNLNSNNEDGDDEDCSGSEEIEESKSE